MTPLPTEHRVLSFSQAEGSKMPAEQRRRMHALASKIPENMRGLFDLIFEPDEHRKPKLFGLRLNPDRATSVIHGFREQLGIHGRVFQHGKHFTYVLSGPALDLVLADDESRVLTPHAGKLTDSRMQKRLQARHVGVGQYEDTYPIADLLQHQELSLGERQALEKIVGNIPADLRGLFYAKLERFGEETRIASLGIDPLLSMPLLNKGLLKQLPGTPFSNPTPIALSRSESEEEIRHPDTQSMISGEHIALRLAAVLPTPSVHREY